jgi:hypothetical protein
MTIYELIAHGDLWLVGGSFVAFAAVAVAIRTLFRRGKGLTDL